MVSQMCHVIELVRVKSSILRAEKSRTSRTGSCCARFVICASILIKVDRAEREELRMDHFEVGWGT
jgi:hypothetical protein